MKQYWNNLQPRERFILLGGALALLLMVGYLAVLEPFQKELHRLRQSVSVQRQDLAWMQQAAVEVKRLRGSKPAVTSSAGQSLLTLVDGSAKASGLGGALKRVQPDGQNSVRVWFEQASFDDVLKWLDRLDATARVRVSGLVVERQELPGRVNVRVVLEGAG